VKTEVPDREALFEPTRSRTLHSAVPQLPGQPSGTEKLIRATGPCPDPIRVLHAPFDEQWLIPDHRLIDVARPELWRWPTRTRSSWWRHRASPAPPAHCLLASTILPLLRPGRVRPLYRRPHAEEPNLAPGLLEHLADHFGHSPTRRTSSPGRWRRPAPDRPYP